MYNLSELCRVNIVTTEEQSQTAHMDQLTRVLGVRYSIFQVGLCNRSTQLCYSIYGLDRKSIIRNKALPKRQACWVKIASDDILEYFFLVFPIK